MFRESELQNKYFWTFKEILEGGGDPIPAYQFTDENILAVVSAMEDYSTPLINELGEWTDTNIKKLVNLIVKRYINMYIITTETEDFPVEQTFNFVDKLFYIIEMTSPRYLTLLKAYSDSATKLLDPVKVTTNNKSRFNDTPQNNGSYETDPFTTNITFLDSVSQNEADTIMGRIRELESSYNNLLLIWSNEFKSLFLEEENI